eukprot:scaffold274053_cov28-Tisochrysis_lutea.AAC.1
MQGRGGLSSEAYRSRSTERKRSGLRASTICTMSCERSSTRQSWRHTSRFFSKGVRHSPSSSSRLARCRRHARNAERSASSSCSAFIPSVHTGRRGTGRSVATEASLGVWCSATV